MRKRSGASTHSSPTGSIVRGGGVCWRDFCSVSGFYLTEPLHAAWEQPARANLADEIAQLT